MLHDKMCVGIMGNDLMCRISPGEYDQALERTGCRQMDFTGRALKGFVLIGEEGMRNAKEFDYWMQLAVSFNPQAKSSKKKKKV